MNSGREVWGSLIGFAVEERRRGRHDEQRGRLAGHPRDTEDERRANPDRAVGRTTRQTVCQLDAPSARLASRSPPGHDPQHHFSRAGHDRRHRHRQGQRHREAVALPAQAEDQQGVDEQAREDVRQCGHRLDNRADDPGDTSAHLGQEDRGADAQRNRDRGRDRQPARPTRRSRANTPPWVSGAVGGRRSCCACRSSGDAAPASPCRRRRRSSRPAPRRRPRRRTSRCRATTRSTTAGSGLPSAVTPASSAMKLTHQNTTKPTTPLNGRMFS